MTQSTNIIPTTTTIDIADLEETYSNDGPVCPGCGAQWTTDEAHYYNQGGYKLACDVCGVVFEVEAEATWSWTGKALRRDEVTNNGH